MNFSLTLQTNDATVLRAISTAAAMIEYHADGDIASPAFGLADAITTTAWIADALNETLGDFEAVGLGPGLSEVVPTTLLERLAYRLQALATTLLAPPPTEEAMDARLAEAQQILNDYITAGISPAASDRRLSVEMCPIDGEEDDDLFGFDAIPA